MNIIELFKGDGSHGTFYSTTVRKSVSFGGLGDIVMTKHTKGKQDEVVTLWMNDLDFTSEFEVLPERVWFIEALKLVCFSESDAKAAVQDNS